ncbi:MAG: PEP-CTERM sorting domain-containing protein [Planctomycetaceae bacterium]
MTSIPCAIRRLCLSLLLASCGGTVLAQSFSMSVASTSNLYAVGQTSLPLLGGGTLPPAVLLTPGTGRVLTFATVSGSVSYNDVDAPPAYLGQYNGPDGGAVNFQDASWPNNYLTTSGTPGLLPPSAANAPTTFYMDMASSGGVSGMLLYESDPAARLVMFLAGVFTSGGVPQAPAPAILNFSSTFGSDPLGTSFTQLSPLLNQTFYIGDGLTGTGSGTAQSFFVPDGATHFSMGIVDGSYFVGAPDYYDNNRGSFAVQGMIAVPEPSTWVMGAVGIACASWSAWRRRKRA